MSKNVENMNPFHDEVHEDEARIFKNDPQHNFVPIEQVKDEQEHDPYQETSEGVTEEKEIEFEHRDPEIEQDVWEQRRIEQLSQDIKFSSGEGVASVGPDVEGGDSNEEEVVKRDDVLIVSAPPVSMSPAKLRYESRRLMKNNKQKGAGHDNHKKQRYFRNFIKNLFGFGNSSEEKMQSVQDTIDLQDEYPTLNGKTIDRNLIEKDDIAA